MSEVILPRAEIRKTKSKRQPFRTVFISKNGQDIGGSKETLTTRLNALKNITAHLNFFGGKEIWVVDLTTKNKNQFLLHADGGQTPF